MSSYNFTERTRKALALAREEALRLRHEHVAPEHILLGLVREGEGVAIAVLQNLGVDVADLRSRIEARMSAGREVNRPMHDLPYTSQAKKVLETSMHEGRQLNHSYVGTEHLLLGLLRAGGPVVTEVLEGELGVPADGARAEMLRLLGVEGDSCRIPPSSRPGDGSSLEFEIRVRLADGRMIEHRCRGSARPSG